MERIFEKLKRLKLTGLLLIAVALTGMNALAADFYLVVKPFDKTLSDGTVVPCWGFATDADSDLNTDGGETPTVPGPRLIVPAGDSTLTIHVRNDLTDDAVSIVVPGQPAILSPVRFTDVQGRSRVRSFTAETAPNGGIGAYTWTGLKPGTFLYHSGTQAQVQVQMGLYGAVTRDFAAGQAYDSTPYVDGNYDSEVLLFYSEIDPALHQAVATGEYGTQDYPSTIGYRPTYFLVNGDAWTSGTPAIPAGDVGDRVLIRFLSAALSSHVPDFTNQFIKTLAEDGHRVPYATVERPSFLLPAGKTCDAIWTPGASGTYPVYDRKLGLTSDNVSGGGMLVYLEIATGGAFFGNGRENGPRPPRVRAGDRKARGSAIPVRKSGGSAAGTGGVE